MPSRRPPTFTARHARALDPRLSIVRDKWLFGGVLMLLGFGWIAANRILVTSYPAKWGGPNFGAGALLLLATGAIVTGVVLLATSYRDADKSERVVTLAAVGLAIGVVVLAYALTAGDPTQA